MPRFLDINYLGQAIQYHKSLLNRMLLTVPHHLEQVDSYVHRGIIPDTAYLSPWIRAKVYKDVLPSDSDISDNILALKEFYGISDIEPYYSSICDVVRCRSGWSEVIPSSNPSSQSSLEDEVLANLLQQYDTCAATEMFFKEPLCQSTCNDDPEFHLEDLESVDYLQEYALNVPRPDTLLQRLRPKVVKDPFIDDQGNQITHEQLFRDDLLYSMEGMTPVTVDVTCTEETFHTEPVLWDVPGTLEEELVLVHEQTAAETKTIDEMVPTSQQLKEILKLEEEVLSPDDHSQIRGDMKKLSQATNDLNLDKTEVLQCDETPECDEKKSFKDFNDQGASPEITFVQRAVLESPSVINTVLTVPEEYRHPWNQHSMYEISMNVEQNILTRGQQDQMQKMLWNSEKYFSDVLTMRLPEPVIRINYLEYLSPSNVMRMLSLKPTPCEAGLELDLVWDPIADSTSAAIKWERRQLRWDVADSGSSLEKVVDNYDPYDLSKKDKEGFLDSKNLICDTDVLDVRNERDGIIGESSVIQCKDISATRKTADKLEISKLEAKNVTQNSVRSSVPRHTRDFQLDQFFMMTSGELASTARTTVEKIPISGALSADDKQKNKEKSVVKELLSDAIPGKGITSITPAGTDAAKMPTSPSTPSDLSKKRSKVKIMEIFPSDSLLRVLCWIEGYGQPMLSQLISEGLLPTAQEFTTLKPNITHFMVKQHEKTCKDSGETGITATYSAVQSLHVLTCVFDLALNLSLQSAASYISTCQEKYKHLTVSGGFGKLRQQLFEEHHKQQQNRELHPKMANLCTDLAIWLAKKKKKSPGHDPKILVILKREVNSLVQSLVEVLNTLDGINTHSLMNNRPHTSQEILNKLDAQNCLLCTEVDLQSNFPWAQFSLVVEYEHNQQQIQWMTLCERQNIRFLGLVTVSEGKLKDTDAVQSELKTISETTPLPHKEIDQAQFVVIGSQKLTNQQELLKLMENRHNITVYERDYTVLKQSHIVYADIILDERQCIILQDASMISEDIDIETLTDRLLGLALQFLRCWIIVLPHQIKGKNQYSYGTDSVTCLAKLQGIISALHRQFQDFQVKVVYCSGIPETSAVIRRISTLARQNTPVWDTEDWTKRNWLTQSMTKHEKFLLTIPCINSFSAQVMLTIGSLKSLLTMDSVQLVQACPWLPLRILQHFYRFINLDESVRADKLSFAVGNIDPGAIPAQVGQSFDEATMLTGGLTSLEQSTGELVDSGGEEDNLETIALIPSQPGPNEFEKSELALSEQRYCKPVYKSGNGGFVGDRFETDRLGGWQQNYEQQDYVHTDRSTKEDLIERGVNKYYGAGGYSRSDAPVKPTVPQPQTYPAMSMPMPGVPDHVVRQSEMQIGGGPRPKLSTVDLGAAGDGSWVTGKLTGGENLDRGVTEQAPGYRSYPNRKHSRLWTQFEDLPVADAFAEKLTSSAGMRHISDPGGAVARTNPTRFRSQHQTAPDNTMQLLGQKSGTSRALHQTLGQSVNPTDWRLQNQIQQKDHNQTTPINQSEWNLHNTKQRQISRNPSGLSFPNSSDLSLQNQPNQRPQAPFGPRLGNFTEEKPANHMPNMQRESFQNRNTTPRTPGIAPVTPRVRQPLQALAMEHGGDVPIARAQQPLHSFSMDPSDVPRGRDNWFNRGSASCRDNWSLYAEDSPPMDLGSPGQSLVPANQRMIYSYQMEQQHVTLSPAKKRRLTYEKIPGKKGQTRLNFI